MAELPTALALVFRVLADPDSWVLFAGLWTLAAIDWRSERA